MLLITGCLDKEGYIDGEFALDGFIFDVEAPNIQIVESRPGFANTTNVTFLIFTGVDKANCVSLAKFTITQSSSTPGLAAFTDECTTDGIQTKVINAGIDGSKTFYIHAMSAQGKYSAPKSVSFILDTTAPTVNFTDIGAGPFRGGSSIALNYDANDVNGLESFVLDFAADGTNFVNDRNIPFSATGGLYAFPTTDVTTNVLRVVAVDNAGNSTTISTSAFETDSTPPTISVNDLASILQGASGQNIVFSSSDLNGIGSSSLLFAADGINFVTEALNPTSPYSWTVPSIDQPASVIRYVATDSVGNISTANTSSFIIDSTAPSATLNNLAAVIQGGSSQNITFSNSDTNGIASISLDYAADGTNFSTNLTTTNTSPFSWSVPVTDTTGSRLRLTVTDNAGLITQITTSPFNIDSTGPSINLADLAAAIRGGVNNTVTFTATDANGVATETLQYASDGTTFTDITSGMSSPYSWATPSDDVSGARLRFVAVDSVGNTTSVTNAAFIVDSTAPTLTIDDLAAVLQGGSSHNIVFTNTDANGVASISLDYAADGTNFSTNLTTTNSSPFSWTVPSTDTTGSRIRLTATDIVGNSANIVNSPFNIDSTAPSLTLDNLASVILGGSTQGVSFTNSDANGVASISLDYAADGTNFSTNLTTANSSPFSWSVPSVDTTGSALRLTVTDIVGNSASVTNSTFNIDSTAPSLSLADLPLAIAGGGTTNVVFTTGETNGVASISLDYAADGTNFTTNLTTTNSSPYSWSVPSVNTTGSRLRLTVTDVVGNQAIVTNAGFNIDSIAPSATLDDLASVIQGGSSQNVTFTNSDTNGIASISLDYAADGSTFSTNLTTTNSSPYSWTVPSVDTSASRLQLTVTDNAGNTTIVTNSAFIIDSTGPTLTLANLAVIIRGGSTQSIAFTNSDANGVASISLDFASDGTNFSSNLTTTNSSPYSWSVPIMNTSGSRLRLTATDNVGNISTITNSTFDIDSTPPALPVATLASADPSNSTAIQITIASCTDRPFIFVNESTQPFRTDPDWQACSTTAGAITYTIEATEVTHNLRVWAKDSVGNVTASSTNLSMVYDETPPIVTVTSPANNSYAKNSVVMSGACEIGSNVDFSGDVAADFSIACSTGTWSQNVNFLDPLVDGNKNIVVSQTDPAGNTTTVNRTYINDNLPPIITRTSPGSPILTNGNSQTWSGTCEGNYTVTVGGDASGNFACSSGSWTWTTPSVSTDGTRNYTLTQTDAAGNTSTALPLQWTRDQTPPVFTYDRTSPEINNKSSLIFNGTCEGTNPIAITGAANDNISCSAGSWTWTCPTVSTDGTRTYTFTQTDGPGNTSVINHQWTRDTTGPNILVDLDKEIIKNNDSGATITGTCDMSITTTTITVSGSAATTIPCSSGTFTFIAPDQLSDGTRTYNFSQTNDLSTTTTVSAVWIRETNPPVVNTLSKGTGVVDPSRSNFINTNITATSANSLVGIAKMCFLSNNNTQPATTDECWVDVNSPQIGHPIQQNLSVTDYSNLLGWQPIFYTVYAFVMDEAENISSLSGAGIGTIGVDKYTISYDPGIPPVLADVVSANTDVTANPPTLGQTNVPAGSDVYIRWKATDNIVLPSQAITLNYTQDEISFVPITLTNPADPANPAANFSGLNNTNYGCPGITLGANEGCYKWTGGSPLNTAYKIQVVVKDSSDIEVKMISNPMNSGNIQLLAGNTESDLGGAAEAAMF